MASESGRTQLVRLLRLIVTLQGQTYPSAKQLADGLHVTRRTIYRDLAALESAGLPVQFDRARKGYAMPANLGVNPARTRARRPARRRSTQE